MHVSVVAVKTPIHVLTSDLFFASSMKVEVFILLQANISSLTHDAYLSERWWLNISAAITSPSANCRPYI